MKTITFNVFTSLSEVNNYFKKLKSKRYKYNSRVFKEFAEAVNNEIKSDYWSNDISEYARNELTNLYYGKINRIYNEYKNKLK